MAWKPRNKKWDWFAYCTEEERVVIRASEKAMSEIERLRERYRKNFARDRQVIVNRAIQRAKHAELG